MWALEKGMYVAGAAFAAAAYGVIVFYLEMDITIFFTVAMGLAAGMLIGKITEYYTSFDFGPVISIKDRGMTGPATVVIQGIGVGNISCPARRRPCVHDRRHPLARGQLWRRDLGRRMLATPASRYGRDGPVADNAGGLAEMAYLGKEVRRSPTRSTLSATRPLRPERASRSARPSSPPFPSSRRSRSRSTRRESRSRMTSPTDRPRGRPRRRDVPAPLRRAHDDLRRQGAAEIINEVREQFKSHKNAYGFTLGQCIRLYKEKYDQFGEGNWKAAPAQEVVPDSSQCVQISTLSSVREMIAPGAYAVLAPLIGGFLVGPRFLVGMLAGAVASGCMLAIMMANAGGAWDNSSCARSSASRSRRSRRSASSRRPASSATLLATPSGPLGPALNILIKLMSMVSLTVAPLLSTYTEDFLYWYYGLAPLGVAAILTAILVQMNILTWDDPLANMLAAPAPAGKKAMV